VCTNATTPSAVALLTVSPTEGILCVLSINRMSSIFSSITFSPVKNASLSVASLLNGAMPFGNLVLFAFHCNCNLSPACVPVYASLGALIKT